MQSETVGLHIEIVLWCKNGFGQDKTPCSWQDYWISIGWCHVYWFALQFWAHSLFVYVDNVGNRHIAIVKNSVSSLFLWRTNKRISFISVCFLLMQPHLLKHKNLFPHIFYILYLHQWCTVTTCGCLFICLTDYWCKSQYVQKWPAWFCWTTSSRGRQFRALQVPWFLNWNHSL